MGGYVGPTVGVSDAFGYGAPSGAGSSSMGWIGPAIGGAASLGGAALGGKAAKEAGKTQLQGQREALAYQREQQAKEEARYSQAMGLWNASRRILASRYGLPMDEGLFLNSPGPTAPAGAGPAGPGGPAASLPSRMAGGYTGQGSPVGSNLGDMIQPGNLEDWNDWKRLRLG